MNGLSWVVAWRSTKSMSPMYCHFLILLWVYEVNNYFPVHSTVITLQNITECLKYDFERFCSQFLWLCFHRRLSVQQARRDLEVSSDRGPGEGSHGLEHVLEQAQPQRRLQEDRQPAEEEPHLSAHCHVGTGNRFIMMMLFIICLMLHS